MMHMDALVDDVSAVETLRRHANHPSAYLALNRDTSRFRVSGVDGLIAYRYAGRRHVVMAAGITAASENRVLLLDHFLSWARAQRRKVIAVQMLREDAELLAQRGFRVNQVGGSYSVGLAEFKIAGTAFIKLRNKISRARRAGVEVMELGNDLPMSPELAQSIRSIDEEWIRGKHAKELEFLVGEVGDLTSMDYVTERTKRIFVAMTDGAPVAYVLYVASFGASRGWMHDLSRRLSRAPTGTMELINITAIERFKAERAQMLNFGFTPLTALDPEHEIPGAWSRMAAWIFKQLALRGSFIYPAQTQLAYKMKWAPSLVQPEYVAFQGGFTLGALWQFLRLTKAI
jgi:lysylphosphatidylglycerol synthetase-like protein (DUF2156 family)